MKICSELYVDAFNVKFHYSLTFDNVFTVVIGLSSPQLMEQIEIIGTCLHCATVYYFGRFLSNVGASIVQSLDGIRKK